MQRATADVVVVDGPAAGPSSSRGRAAAENRQVGGARSCPALLSATITMGPGKAGGAAPAWAWCQAADRGRRAAAAVQAGGAGPSRPAEPTHASQRNGRWLWLLKGVPCIGSGPATSPHPASDPPPNPLPWQL